MAGTGVTIDFNANLARFTSSIDKATSDLNRFQSNTQRVAGNIKAAFGAIGAGVAAIKLAGLVKDSIDAADRLYDLSLKTGASVKALASLDLVATQSGTSIEEVGKGINKLSIYMAQNAEEAKALGITAADPVEAYIQLADVLTKIESPQLRAATASKILGKSYQDQLPLLLQGGAAISAAARASEEYAKAMEKAAPLADEFNDKLSDLKQSSSLFAMQATVSLLPALNQIVTAMGQAARESGVLKAAWVGLGGIGAALFTNEFAAASTKINALRADISTWEREIKQLEGGGLLQRWLFGTKEELQAKISKAKTEIAALQKQVDTPAKAKEPPKIFTPIESTAKAAKGIKQPKIEPEKPINVFGNGSFTTSDKDVAEFIREQQEAINDLNRAMYVDGVHAAEEYQARLESLISDTAVVKTKRFLSDLEFIDKAFFEGTLDAETYAQAVENLTGETSKINESLKEGKTFAEEFGLAFESAFEDAIVSGKSFGDVLKALEQDIARIIIRKSVTEPLGGAISSIVGKIDFGSIFKNIFPSFDVGTPFVKQDTMAFVHKGEAIIPAQYNKPGAMGGVSIVQHINIDSRSDQATIMAAMNQAKEAAKADILASIRRGGTFAAV